MMKKKKIKTKIFLYMGTFIFAIYLLFLITPEFLDQHVVVGLCVSIVPVLTAGSTEMDKYGKAYKKIQEQVEHARKQNPEINGWRFEKKLTNKVYVRRMAITFLLSLLIGTTASYLGVLVYTEEPLEGLPPSRWQ